MRIPYRNKKATLWVMFGIVVVTMFLFKFTELRPTCLFRDVDHDMMVREEKYVVADSQKVYAYNREMPLIFIGGVPRSGTTLMRAMLDAHPDVRCGQETRVIPRILQLRTHWMKSEKESLRLKEAGISKEVMNSAIAQFCLEIIAKHGDPAPRLCNKDPLTLKMGTYVIELFPNAKFLFMVRDGRATVHSIISRKVTITGFDLTSYRQCMTKWNHAIEVMHGQCRDIGKERCMMVYYEQLVLHPEAWMRKILTFLDVPWNDSVLHHEEFINKPNGVSLSKVERSSDQVIKPVNLEALTKWVNQMPDDVVRDMADIAPMLSVLGYDPYANPPNYGKPDAWVEDNTFKLKANQRLWENKAKEMDLRVDLMKEKAVHSKAHGDAKDGQITDENLHSYSQNNNHGDIDPNNSDNNDYDDKAEAQNKPPHAQPKRRQDEKPKKPPPSKDVITIKQFKPERPKKKKNNNKNNNNNNNNNDDNYDENYLNEKGDNNNDTNNNNNNNNNNKNNSNNNNKSTPVKLRTGHNNRRRTDGISEST